MFQCYKWRSQNVYELMGLKCITVLIPPIMRYLKHLRVNHHLRGRWLTQMMIPGNFFRSCRWAMNLATAKKSETRGQKFIQVFPGNKKTWINCEESNTSESAAWTPLPLRIAKKSRGVCHCWEPRQQIHRLRYLSWLGLNKQPFPLQGCWCPRH